MSEKKITANDELPQYLMENFAKMLASLLQGRGFCLVVTPINTDLPIQYVSNVERKGAHDMLEQMCQKWRTQS